MTVSAEQRQTLEMLAEAGARGSTLDMLLCPWPEIFKFARTP